MSRRETRALATMAGMWSAASAGRQAGSQAAIACLRQVANQAGFPVFLSSCLFYQKETARQTGAFVSAKRQGAVAFRRSLRCHALPCLPAALYGEFTKQQRCRSLALAQCNTCHLPAPAASPSSTLKPSMFGSARRISTGSIWLGPARTSTGTIRSRLSRAAARRSALEPAPPWSPVARPGNSDARCAW